MINHWNQKEAKKFIDNPLEMRSYTSNLIGQDPSLVLHGGGNTSVKISKENIFGEKEDLLYVKGSGWDLKSIKPQGFSPVKMDSLLRLSDLEKLTDSQMAIEQKAAMTDPSYPGPSVEAILHALIPFKYVDHTHADAVVTLTNSNLPQDEVRKIFGDKVLWIPYVMPGFILARKVKEMTQDVDWSQYHGMILDNHGVFSFSDDAKESYLAMLEIVGRAEDYLEKNLKNKDLLSQPKPVASPNPLSNEDALLFSKLRNNISEVCGKPMLCHLDDSKLANAYASSETASVYSQKGPLTPDHVIHTKRIPMIFTGDSSADLSSFEKNYEGYFKKNTDGDLQMLNPAPRFALWAKRGSISFGENIKRTFVVRDISAHTRRAILWAEDLNEWNPLPEKDIFDVEYWELEQAKLKKGSGAKAPEFQGKIALVTGVASGIGKACSENLLDLGACVIGIDLKPDTSEVFSSPSFLGISCDVTNEELLSQAILKGVSTFGGIDHVVSNAGTFPKSAMIEEMDSNTWDQILNINLNSHRTLMKLSIPFLKNGINPSFVFIGSKNVPAPGPGASAYSVSKAGITQLSRVAAMELAQYGIRVNTVHPDAVFDTGVWTKEVLETRAKKYEMSVDEYKRRNLLKQEVSSQEVATVVNSLLSGAFSKTTGAQIPIDGGNDRVI